MYLSLIPVLRVMESVGSYSDPKENVLISQFDIKYNEIGFVEWYSLTKVKKKYDRVLVVFPAPCRPHHIEQDMKCAGWPRVSFGVYWSANHLLLIEDVEKWCQKQLEFDKIRNIFDLKQEFTENPTRKDNGHGKAG